MTLRMKLAYVALAAFGAPDSGHRAAVRAATKICDVMPWRCRYNPDGGSLLDSGSSHAGVWRGVPTGGGAATGSHAWGCSATTDRRRGPWGFPNKAAAHHFRALSECAKRSAHCHILSCSPFRPYHTKTQATLFSGANR